MPLRFKQVPVSRGVIGSKYAFDSTDAYAVYFEGETVSQWLRAEFDPATWWVDSNGLVITVHLRDHTQAVAFRLQWC